MRLFLAFVSAALAASLIWHGSVVIHAQFFVEAGRWQLADLVYPLIITPMAMLVFGVPLHFLLRLSGVERTAHRVLAGLATGTVFAAIFWVPGAQAFLTGAAAGASASAIFYRIRDGHRDASTAPSSGI